MIDPSTAAVRSVGELIVASVVHERTRPASHRFRYRLFCLRLDVERLNEVDQATGGWLRVDPPTRGQRLRPFTLYTRDYGARDGSPLAAWAREQAAAAGVKLLPGASRIELQTFPRLFGFVFNPVSFWLCHDEVGALRVLIAEVNNTFGEHHFYVVTAEDRGVIGSDTALACRKAMHVSPFCQVRGRYRFRVTAGRTARRVDVDYYDGEQLLIATRIAGHAVALNGAVLRAQLLRFPFMTIAVVARIHWQALKLWLKRVPWFHKPDYAGPLRTGNLMTDSKEGRA
ncbi:MAG: DUF1365 domain-containing protein [Burkholderiales bacterium]|nr:DUF1365 domain-containing protein [Burkholderiales bacterium]